MLGLVRGRGRSRQRVLGGPGNSVVVVGCGWGGSGFEGVRSPGGVGGGEEERVVLISGPPRVLEEVMKIGTDEGKENAATHGIDLYYTLCKH